MGGDARIQPSGHHEEGALASMGSPTCPGARHAPDSPGAAEVRAQEVGSPLFDMHCHLAFAPNAVQAVQSLAQDGSGAFAACVTPAETQRLQVALAPWSNVAVGVGLHPWWVSLGRVGTEDVEQAARQAARSRFVGEVGLDCSKQHAPAFPQQQAALLQVMSACAEGGKGDGHASGASRKVVTLHAVRAADAVLDVLQDTGAIEACTCIFHWYSDTPEALQRAIRLGCRFSLGVRSLSTRRGREYARQIPDHLLLLETDDPAEGVRYDVDAVRLQLAQALALLEDIKGHPLGEQIATASRQLLAIEGSC